MKFNQNGFKMDDFQTLSKCFLSTLCILKNLVASFSIPSNLVIICCLLFFSSFVFLSEIFLKYEILREEPVKGWRSFHTVTKLFLKICQLEFFFLFRLLWRLFFNVYAVLNLSKKFPFLFILLYRKGAQTFETFLFGKWHFLFSGRR